MVEFFDTKEHDSNPMKKSADHHQQNETVQGLATPTDIRLHSSNRRHYFRLFLVTFAVLTGGIAVALIGLFFLFQGGAIENTALNSRIERSIVAFLGPQYDVQLGPTKVELRGTSLISITSTDVAIKKIGADNPIATIGKVLVGINPLSFINGQVQVKSVTVQSSKLYLDQIVTKNPHGIPTDMKVSFEQLGQGLALLQSRLVKSEMRSITVKDSVLIGFKPGRNSSAEFAINNFVLKANRSGDLDLALDADSGLSQIDAKAAYSTHSNQNASLTLDVSGVDVREWTKGLEAKESFFASDAKMRAMANITFNKDNSAQQPVVRLLVGNSGLRLGRKGNTKINRLALNFRLFPELNRVILEKSQVSIGGFQALIVGGITPVNSTDGLAGELDYTLVVERAQGTATQTGERIHPGSMIVEGGYNREKKLLSIDQYSFSVSGGSLIGSASLGFNSETPSLVLNGVSRGLPMAAVKQFWPVFLATGVRKWVHEHVYGGKVTNATISASIPGGILGRLHKGRRLEDDQFSMDVNIEDVRFDTFGDLAPVRSADGKVRIRGMRADVELENGTVYIADNEPIKLKSGNFVIADIALRPLVATAEFNATGPLASLAELADAKPLNVMDRLKMKASQWSGDGIVNVSAEFPLRKKLKYQEVSWRANIELDRVKSSKLIAGRNISNAKVVIDLVPDKATITGNSTIDGIQGKVLLIEPIGKDSKVKRKRVLKARMGPKDRKKIGLTMAPVITGPIDVVMEQSGDKKIADISIDLKNAVISLPWIGWRKGAGIPAKASFEMVKSGKATKINHLVMRGKGFLLNGDMVFDKSGIRSADISNVSLNEGDDLSARIRRSKGAYTITLNGDSFDGRVLVNKLFHQPGNNKEQGRSTFKLSANIKQVKGFGNRTANNLVLHYSVKKGWLDGLSLDTNFGKSQKTTLKAESEGDSTNFKIRSQNAGSALSFLNLYTHMVNGIMVSNLKRKRGKPFFGDVRVENFTIVDEPKLKKLVTNRQVDEVDRGGRLKREFSKIKTSRVKFPHAQASIEKGAGYLKMNGSLTGIQIGLTYNGTLYDAKNRMDIKGTFMPAFGISKIVSAIPFVGQILSNGRDSALIGITYHLAGPINSPKLLLNPLSIVAPGIFKKVFEAR